MLSGCAVQQEAPPANNSSLPISAPDELPATSSEVVPPVDNTEPESEQETNDNAEMHPYIAELVSNIVEQISTPDMSEYERAKAAFDYIIQNTVSEEPIGLDLWRIHGGGEEPIPFIEQRALSPLRFGVGMCEDYACALALLLRGMGLEADYVPGLSYTVEGELADHFWTIVKIDGVWYHLDSHLQDHIARHGYVSYRYFLKGDATMSASHRWGQNLINSGLMTEEQNAELAENFLTPACPQDYPTPERLILEDSPMPDIEALQREAQAEISAWEEENGPLPEMELNTTPPVFGWDGYGPPDA